MRRSLLFLPGNNPGNVQSGGLFGADAVVLDLEDAVAPAEKDAARDLVAAALQTVDYGTCEKFVRINSLDHNGARDIRVIVPCGPDVILLPKIESPAEVVEQVKLIKAAERPGQKPVVVMAVMETPIGVVRAYDIAVSDPRVTAISLGAEDYTAAMGLTRTKEGQEIFVPRATIANIASAAGVDCIDTPFTDVNDSEGLLADTLLSKSLGYQGKVAINPRQIDTIHQAYAPTETEIRWAQRVVEAVEEGKRKGSGVVAVGGKLIDPPVVARANRTIDMAIALHLVKGV